MTATDYSIRQDDDCANWHLAFLSSNACFGQGSLHHGLVAV